MEAGRSLLDGGFGEARELEEPAGDGGIAGGVESGSGFRLVGCDGGAGVEVGAWANGDFDIMQGALGFDDAVPAKRGVGFGERRDLVSQFAAVSAGFESGDSVTVENDADTEIED